MNLNRFAALAALLFIFNFSDNVYAAFPDSTGIKIENGKKYIIHKVEPKEGWMAIARRYGVPMDQVISANPGVIGLKIGQIIYVPLAADNKAAQTSTTNNQVAQQTPQATEKQEIKLTEPEKKPEVNTAANNDDKYKSELIHTVATGETLFSIAKKYNTTAGDLIELNDLESNSIQPGQELVVGYVFKYSKNPETSARNDAGSNEEVKKTRKEIRQEKREAKRREEELKNEEKKSPAENNTVIATPTTKEEIKKPETKKEEIKKTTVNKPETTPEAPGKKAVPVTERGIASWIDDNDVNPSKYYALHRTAAPGTIIKVTNRMNQKSVFVKVVGVLPDTGDNANITIKLSKAAANKLDVIDARFQAELSYTNYE